MFAKLELTRMAQALAAHAGARMGVIAENVANADTPDYEARDLESFSSFYSAAPQMRATRAGHIGASRAPEAEIVLGQGSQSPNGNSVSLEMEMVKTAAARTDHDMALAVQRATTSVLRAALGRS